MARTHNPICGRERPTRVLLLEDDVRDAELIAHVLQRAIPGATMLRVDTKAQFTAALAEFCPDVILCDHSLVRFNAVAALEVVRRACPATPVIVVSGTLDERATVACLRAGAEDLLLKTHLAALPGMVNAAIEVRRRLASLSPRQLQVMRLIAEGHGTRAVASRLSVSVKTAESHRTEVMKRLGVHDVAGVVRAAVRFGLVASTVGQK